MADSFFFLKDGTYALSSWTYDDGMLHDPEKVILRPDDDVDDDSQAYPADTVELHEEEVAVPEEEILEEPIIPALEEAPPSVDWPPSNAQDLLSPYYGKPLPYRVLEPLAGPKLHLMQHPKDTLPIVTIPKIKSLICIVRSGIQ
jgi:hypothetical protein